MKTLKVLLITFLFPLPQPTVVKAVMSDSEFFDSMNLDYSGLDSVKSALVSGDTLLAKAKLLDYYQDRTSVHYFELSGSGNISEANDNLEHYFTVIDIRKYGGDSDGTIDWGTYDSNDDQWHYQFHRMYWVVNLGKVYGTTQDEAYADEWVAELIDWIRDNSPGYPRTLDTGIRLRNWVESYQYFINEYVSPSITAEDHVTVLKSLMEQSRFLRDNWRNEGNWGASETRGLGAVVVMFPEFNFTPDGYWEWWRDLVISRMQHHLSNDFYPDGVQFETSPSYHSLEYRNLFLNYTLMELNGVTLSDALTDLFIKPLEFMMHIHKPDGFLPQLSDTDRKGYLDRLKEGAELFDRQDMLYAATRGAQGAPPQETFAPFPEGGYFVMRGDWGEEQASYGDTKYFVFDTGSNEPWHAHYDILNFEAYANGSVLVRDPGRYTYVAGYWRDYFKSTTAHNTIVIDNNNQNRHVSGSATYWATLPGFDYVSGNHGAYAGLTHERSVFFVKPDYWIISDLVTGSGSHVFDLYFHLDSPYINHTVMSESDHSVSTPNFVIMPSDVSASAEVISGWVSNSYNSKSEAPIAKYQKNGSPPVTFETILLPYDSGPVPLSVDKPVVFFGQNEIDPAEAVCLRIQSENMTDWFFHSSLSPGILSFASFQCDATAARVRIESDNTISSIQLVKGSFLYRGDTLLVDTDAEPANVSWFQHAVYVQAEYLQNTTIWAPQTDSVIVNGEKVSFVQNGNYVELSAVSVQDESGSTSGMAEGFQLEQNYPNPFNRSTSIRFILHKRDRVNLRIYDLSGHLVITLTDGLMVSGEYTVYWNGRDRHERASPSGIYFYRLKVGDDTTTRRMLLLK